MTSPLIISAQETRLVRTCQPADLPDWGIKIRYAVNDRIVAHFTLRPCPHLYRSLKNNKVEDSISVIMLAAITGIS